jgi:hypothetical protein
MKKNILIALVILISLPTLAQENLFDRLTEEYMDVNGFSASQITEHMFDLYLEKKNVEDDSPVYDALNSLDKILVISQSNLMGKSYVSADKKDEKKDEEDYVKSIHETILNYYRENNFTLFKTDKRMTEDVKVFLKKDANDAINTLALITNSNSATNLIELQGVDINMATLSDLGKAFNLRGLENLYKVNNSGYFVGSAGGIGAAVYSRYQLEEMMEREREIARKQEFMTQEQQAELERQAREMEEKQMQLSEKYREMAEKYRRQPIFLTEPGDTNTVYYIDGKKVDRQKIVELEPESIESIEVKKADKENNKSSIRIKTK